MSPALRDLGRLWRTVRPLKARQVFARLKDRAFPVRVVRSCPAPDRQVPTGPWMAGIASRPVFTPPATFNCLGESRSIDDGDGWKASGRTRLFSYSIHYFDDLKRLDAAGMVADHTALIHRWIAENPMPLGAGWEPYPLSLRTVNWIRWALGPGTLTARMRGSLAQQLARLSARPEYHLGGNHLLANAKALLFGGAAMGGSKARDWWEQGCALFAQEVTEQFLSDGGHFERSPMYHAILLEDLLDVVNLCRSYGLPLPEGVAQAIAPAFDWLARMTHPDGAPAYFNDCACGVAPSLAELLDYADRLDLPVEMPDLDGASDLSASGYVRLQTAPGTAAIFDLAAFGAPYINGHGHADTLSLELSVGGARVIVNGGTSTYEPGARRHAERHTAYHSTVCVAGLPSSEIWGAFRCGRTARVNGRSVDTAGAALTASGRHDGYARRATGHVTHARAIRMDVSGLEVLDQLTCRETVTADIRFLIAPGIAAGWVEPTVVRLDGDGVPSIRATLDPAADWTIGDATYASRFGTRENIPALIGSLALQPGQTDLRTRFSWTPAQATRPKTTPREGAPCAG